MFCPKCGNNLPDNATFCNVCGNALNQQPVKAQPAQPVQQPERSDRPPFSLGTKITSIILKGIAATYLLIMFILAIVAATRSYGGYNFFNVFFSALATAAIVYGIGEIIGLMGKK